MKKGFIFTTIFIFILTTSIGSFGLYLVYNPNVLKTSQNDNPNKDLYYAGYLYFYDHLGILINKYQCQNDPCTLAGNTIDDEQYLLDYYKLGVSEINIINYRYAFIDDGQIILLDIKNNDVLGKFTKVKDYGLTLENNRFIVADEFDLWGVIELRSDYKQIIPMSYNYIGLLDNKNITNELIADRFVVSKSGEFSIIDLQNNQLTLKFDSPIINYNGMYVVTYENEGYKVYDYDGQDMFINSTFKYVSFTEKYINIIDENNNLYVYDKTNEKMISESILIETDDYKNLFSSKVINNILELKVIINGEEEIFEYEI